MVKEQDIPKKVEPQDIPQKDDDKVWFQKNSDRLAMLKAINRAVPPISQTTKDLKIADEDQTCTDGTECGSDPYFGTGVEADYVIEKTDRDVPICTACLETLLDNWIEEMKKNIKYNLDKHRVIEGL